MPAALSTADALRIGGVQRFTTIDYPGALAAVVFVQGCPWHCGYCHNAHLQPRTPPPGAPRWADVAAWLHTRRGLLDAVVFSGGEPTLDPALPAAAEAVRAAGFRVGLHTAGLSPRRLAALLPRVDWVGLDVKAPLDDEALHARITGVRGGAMRVARSLEQLLDSGVALQLRTTVHAHWLGEADVRRLQDDLARRGAPAAVLQPGSPPRATRAALPGAPGRT